MSPSTTNQASILVVDDESHIRLVVTEKLRACGYKVLDASDGEEALELAIENQPDLVITDLQMPYMSGLELCTEMKKRPETREIPAILVTARGHILDSTQLAQTNIRMMVSKPFGVRDLVGRVAEVLGTAGNPATGSKAA